MPQDFDLDQFKATYFEECHELLASAEELLGDLQDDISDVDIEVLHAIFRCVHSIKGGAGAFNFTELVSFSHKFETILDLLREQKITLSEEIASVLISANDVLNVLVQAAQDGDQVEPEQWSEIAKELELLADPDAAKAAKTKEENEKQADPQPVSEQSDHFGGYNKTPEEEEEQGWGLFVDVEAPSPGSEVVDEPAKESVPRYLITFVPELHLLRFANEPLLLARELNQLGKCQARADLSRLPDLDKIIPDEAYLSWTFELETDRSLEDIEEVFEFVVDDCDLKIELIANTAANSQEKKAGTKKGEDDKPSPEEPPQEIGEEPQKVEVKKPEPVPAKTKNATPVNKPKAAAVSKSKKQEKPASSNSGKVFSIRVDLDRVDKLVNMVGELVITQAMLKQQAEDLQQNAGQVMAQGFEELSAHTRELQESVMAIRMQPVKSVFARMPRLVRELSSKLNKDIDLITSGEMTEVDKTVIEQLMDPLTHMIRNSVDHGIETREERIAAGKSERAQIELSAEHRSGRIQIEINDDGAGINREVVLQKAREKGIISEDQVLEDEEIDNLIFAPGFSTAQEVSDVSGRGVGMDVVRRNVVNLGGRISVFSSPGKGTRILMSLPLTLAVLDGMIIKCGDEKYIIPLTAIIESIHPVKEELETMVNGGVLVSVRGEYIRVVNLYRLFNVKNAISDPSEALVVIVETERYGLVGVMVDELLGQQQVVIKSLEENYDPIPGISAATILGNGKVALILDVDGLAEMEHGAGKRRHFGNLGQQKMVTGEHAYGIDR